MWSWVEFDFITPMQFSFHFSDVLASAGLNFYRRSLNKWMMKFDATVQWCEGVFNHVPLYLKPYITVHLIEISLQYPNAIWSCLQYSIVVHRLRWKSSFSMAVWLGMLQYWFCTSQPVALCNAAWLRSYFRLGACAVMEIAILLQQAAFSFLCCCSHTTKLTNAIPSLIAAFSFRVSSTAQSRVSSDRLGKSLRWMGWCQWPFSY